MRQLKKNMKLGVPKTINIIFICLFSFSVYSQPIEGNKVFIQILDKITAKVSSFEINVNDTFEYQTLKIDIYACYKNPPKEIPEDFVLLKIFDKSKFKEYETIYQGWMISSSPATTPLEHPIYDLWLKSCRVE